MLPATVMRAQRSNPSSHTKKEWMLVATAPRKDDEDEVNVPAAVQGLQPAATLMPTGPETQRLQRYQTHMLVAVSHYLPYLNGLSSVH